MEIYLIRHTTPAIERNICYGQSDIELAESFPSEAITVKSKLKADMDQVYSSPLKRCTHLAQFLFTSCEMIIDDNLKEINCGEWEMKCWDDIPSEICNKWMHDFVHIPFPGGENYIQLCQRSLNFFNSISSGKKNAAVITHSGVIRSILSHLTQTSLKDSFNKFKLPYGCVVYLHFKNNSWNYTFF